MLIAVRQSFALLAERSSNKNDYPFHIPAIASLNILEVTSRLCFLWGKTAGEGAPALVYQTNRGWSSIGEPRVFSIGPPAWRS